MNKPKVIFVDDDRRILSGYKRVFFSMRKEWDFKFFDQPKDALSYLDGSDVDLVISDMRMPVMNGVEFLKEVRQKCPSAMRMILSGYSDKDMVLETVGLTHQFITKPCDSDLLKRIIVKALELRHILTDPSLMRVLSGIDKLPGLPDSFLKIERELRGSNPSLDKIVKVVSQDPSISAKLLSLANSSFFSTGVEITDIEQAVSLVGIEALHAIYLLICFHGDTSKFADETHLFNHSFAVAKLAEHLLRENGIEEQEIHTAYSAGLLHDLGKLIIADFLPEPHLKIHEAMDEGMSRIDAEKKVMKTTHAEIGAYLMGLWGLPIALVQATAFHHQFPDKMSIEWNALLAVYVANEVINSLGVDLDYLTSRLDPRVVDVLGLVPMLEPLRNKAREFLDNASRIHPEEHGFEYN